MINLYSRFWKYSCYSSYRTFIKNKNNIREIQESTLKRIMSSVDGTLFGKNYGIGKHTSLKSFQSHVPITEYTHYEESLERILRGEKHILTSSRIKRIGLTSGSSGKFKYIPFTELLSTEYSSSISTWIYGLLKFNPKILGGKFYFSVSPSGFPEIKNKNIKIGFDKDGDYLKPWERIFVNNLLVVPESLSNHSNFDFVKYVTCLRLLHAEDLSLVSVWNPSFFISILEMIEKEKSQLLEDLNSGTLSRIHSTPYTDFIESMIVKNKNRSLKLSTLLNGTTKWNEVWPNLKNISLWTNGFAYSSFSKLKSIMPHINYESKGVFATEGSITIPFYTEEIQPLHLLAYTSHFFEFLDSSGNVFLPEEISEGEEYEILMTTGGGLYRYRIGDRFLVVSKFGKIPALQFLGRKDDISDLVGEKLNESFLKREMKELFFRFGFSEENSFVRGNLENKIFFYELIIDFDLSSESEKMLARMFEMILTKNPHYEYARRMGQLGMAKVKLQKNLSVNNGRLSTSKNKFLKAPVVP